MNDSANNNGYHPDNDEASSLPLILINSLRGSSSGGNNKPHDGGGGSSNTSEKDDSGGDDTAESNNTITSFSIGKQSQNSGQESQGSYTGMMPTASIGAASGGPMSSLSGSEEGNMSNIVSREGILRKSGGTSKSDSMSSTSSSSNNNIINNGGDELSECVVVRGKSVTGGSGAGGGFVLPQSEQIQTKVSFAGSTVVTSTKRKRHDHDDTNFGEMATAEQRKKMYLESSNTMQQQMQMQQPRIPSFATVSTSSTSGPFNSKASAAFQQEDKGDPSVITSPADQMMMMPSNSIQKTHHQSHQSITPKSPQIGGSTNKRLERNQREKERSNRIAVQVDTLRTLLQRGGLFIPKNTKSTVLSEASNYIRTLQDRQQLMNMEMEGLKRQLVDAMAGKQQGQGQQLQQPCGVDAGTTTCASTDNNKQSSSSSSDAGGHDYELIFKNTIAGMAVASMGGALLECNAAFQNNTGLSAKDLRGKTIFDIVHPTDLPRALDLISRMIDDGYVGGNDAPSASAGADPAPPAARSGQDFNGTPMVVLKSSFHHRPDLGLCVSLIRGEEDCGGGGNGNNSAKPKCFSVTLAKNVPPPTAGTPQDSQQVVPGVHQIPFNPSLPNYPTIDPQIPRNGKQAPQQGLSRTSSNINSGGGGPKSFGGSTSGEMPLQQQAPPPPNQAVGSESANPAIGQSQEVNNAQGGVVLNAPPVNNTIMNGAAMPQINGIPPQLLQLILLQQQQQQQSLPPNSLHGAATAASLPSSVLQAQASPALVSVVNPAAMAAVATFGQHQLLPGVAVAQSNTANQQQIAGHVQQQLQQQQQHPEGTSNNGSNNFNIMPPGGQSRGTSWNGG